MFDRETAKKIESINAGMGTKHRTKPYVLNNPADLRTMLMMAVGAYRDYNHYKSTLTSLCDDFDESVENFDVASWVSTLTAPEKADMLTTECMDVLDEAEKIFSQLAQRAEDNCVMVLKTVLSSPPATQKAVLGRTYDIKLLEIDKHIEELFVILDEEPYYSPIPDNFDAFLKLMTEQWAIV